MKTTRFAGLFLIALTACPGTPDPVPPPPAAVVSSFTVSTNMVTTPGTLVTLRWETQNTRKVTLEHVGKGPVAIDAAAASGTVDVAITADSTFVLTAQGDGGTDSAVQSVSLTGTGGGLLFDAAPRRIELGGSTTLVWNVPGATSVTIAASTGGNLDLRGQGASGSVLVNPARSTRYTLTAGASTANIDVVVLPVIISFSSTPSPDPGQPVTLSWTTGGGTKLTLTRDGATMPLLTEMSAASIAQGSFEDMPPSLPVEGLLIYRLELEDGANKTTSVLTVRVGGSLRITSFTVPTWARPGFAIPVVWATEGATHLELQADDRTVFVAPTAAIAAAGSTPLSALSSGSQRIKIVARNDRGGVVTLERTVATVGPPTFNSFMADKTTVANGGEPVVLSWSVDNARDVRIVQTGVGVVHTASGLLDTGTVTVYPNRASSEYTLQANNGTGQSIMPQTVTVTVSNVGVLTFARKMPTGATGQVTGHSIVGGTEVWGLPTVQQDRPGEQFVDIVGNGGVSIAYVGPDTTARVVTLPETFSTVLYGRRLSSSSLSISINGWFAFSGTSLSGPDNNSPLPTTAFEPLAIAPYWEDLIDTATSEIYYRLDDANGERRLIVQWDNVEDDAYVGSQLTFQAQVYASGKVVFAYSKLSGAPITPTVGVTSSTELDAVVAPMPPAVGRTFTFFGSPATLPMSLRIENTNYVARVAVGAGFVQVEGDGRLAPGLFAISEANPRPGTGVTNGEWFEVANYSAVPQNLNGWTINFGGTNQHVITTDVFVPAMGRALFAQSADLGEPAAGIMATYVYPATFAMADTSGTLTLDLQVPYTSITWDSTTVPAAGVSVRVDPPPAQGIVVGSPACASTGSGTYGTQTGTPGAAAPNCVAYSLSALPSSSFESAATGTLIDAATDDDVFVVNLPTPVRYNGANVSTLYVSSNGWITTTATTDFNRINRTTPSTANPRGSIAPFWGDLENSAGTNVGMYWLQKDPDMMPGSGDEYTIISWEHWKIFGSSYAGMDLNFEVKFFANGNIEYHYGAMNPATTVGTEHLGTTTTSWLEDFNGRWALAISIEPTPGIAANTAYRYTYSP